MQNRWKAEGKHLIYYGIRQFPNLNKNKIKLSKKERAFLSRLAFEAVDTNSAVFKKLYTAKIIVKKADYIETPKTLEEAVFCTTCVANNYIIPGIEFNADGLCPICADTERQIVSVLPVKNTIEPNKKGRFDAALFYTGGKDSSYLLYYLAKKLGLRVLALTWDIPYMSQNAKLSIENAKKIFTNVEFVHRKIADNDLRAMYKHLIEVQDNTCACPSLAYAAFYGLLCEERVPYLILGNEPAQMKALYYNNIAPKIAYKFQNYTFLHFLLNVGRVLLFKKPFKKGQRELMLLAKQLACGDHFLKKIAGYQNRLISNVCDSMEKIPHLKKSLKKSVKRSDRRASMPALVHIDMNTVSDSGVYDHKKAFELIVEHCGYVMPESTHKSLHTSCQIEAVKDYSQFKAFYEMKSRIIPFSALELIIAAIQKSIDKETALEEMRQSFVLDKPNAYKVMTDYVNG